MGKSGGFPRRGGKAPYQSEIVNRKSKKARRQREKGKRQIGGSKGQRQKYAVAARPRRRELEKRRHSPRRPRLSGGIWVDRARRGLCSTVRMSEDLRSRTKRFALGIIDLWRRLPASKGFQDMGDQLRRAADSMASNYRAARCGRSHAEFRAKLGTVREEADECQHWLEMLQESGLEDDSLSGLRQEATELVAIFTAALKTANQRAKKASETRK